MKLYFLIDYLTLIPFALVATFSQRFKEMKEMHGGGSRDDRQKREQLRQEREMAKFAQMYPSQVSSTPALNVIAYYLFYFSFSCYFFLWLDLTL